VGSGAEVLHCERAFARASSSCGMIAIAVVLEGGLLGSVSIHVALNHVTTYHYDRLVSLSAQAVRLRPAPHCRTRILSYSMRVEPSKHFINWQQDPEGN
jgi:hypothetical protein